MSIYSLWMDAGAEGNSKSSRLQYIYGLLPKIRRLVGRFWIQDFTQSQWALKDFQSKTLKDWQMHGPTNSAT